MNQPTFSAATGDAPGSAVDRRKASELVAAGRIDEALALYRSWAATGQVEAQIEAGRVLLYLRGDDASLAEALHWFERAERSAHPEAAYHLALLSTGGRVVPRDFSRINAWIWGVAQRGSIAAMRAVAMCLGRNSDAASRRAGTDILRQAAQAGDTISALLLAARLRAGAAGAGDDQEARAIERSLAEAGVAPLPHVPEPNMTGAAGSGHSPSIELAFERLLQLPAPQLLSQQPRVVRIPALLSAEECRYVIAMARPHLRRSRTFHPEDGRVGEFDVRTSSDAAFDPVMEDVYLRLLQLRIARAGGCELVQAEHLVVLRYAPGEEYRPHRDYLPASALQTRRPEAGQRRTTVCVYLAPVESGGETEFPVAGLRVAPRTGDAVVFENLLPDGRPDPDSLHAGLPVLKGEKWLATLWLRQGAFRRW